MTTVFQLGSVRVFKDIIFGWCVQIASDELAICVFNCNSLVLLREVVKVFQENPTMAKTMGDFFRVAEKRIRNLELKEATEKVVADLAQAREEFCNLQKELEKRQTLIRRMESRSALLALIEEPGEWVTAPFTGHHSEDSLGDFVKTLHIKNGVLFSLSTHKPEEEHRVAWIGLNSLVAGSHIDNGEMVQYSGPTKGDAIYAWCKRTMERFW